jgi:hypothetical protein
MQTEDRVGVLSAAVFRIRIRILIRIRIGSAFNGLLDPDLQCGSEYKKGEISPEKKKN